MAVTASRAFSALHRRSASHLSCRRLASQVRHASVWSHLSGSLDAATPDFTSIPVLDLHPIASLDPSTLTFPSTPPPAPPSPAPPSSSPPPSLSSLIDSLHSACTNVGFFFITNHSIPPSLISSVFSQSRRFFSLPLPSKLTVSCRDSPNRGYFQIGEENLGDKAEGDQKEGWDMGIEVEGQQRRDASLQGNNRWPSEEDVPGFRAVLERYFTAMMGLSRRLTWLLSRSLQVPHHRFTSISSHPMASLRLAHYPPLDPSSISPSHLGAGAHTDYGLLTIVAQTHPGLEVRNRKGEWIALPHLPQSNALIVNLGDMMQRLSGGLYVSTPHRVVNAGHEGRMSLPFFYEPNVDAVIAVCEELKGREGVSHYDSVIFGDHLRHMYDTTYAKVKLKQQTAM